MKRNLLIQNYQFIVGIDVSKQSLDVCMINAISGIKHQKCFSNNAEGFVALKKWMKSLENHDHHNTLFCMEHTGIYTRKLISYLLSRDAKVWIESSLHIKRSIGLARGKSDTIDAYRIAMFALRNQKDAKLTQLTDDSLNRLKDLNVNRIRLKKALGSIQTPLSEIKEIDSTIAKVLEKANKQALEGIKKSIDKIESLIEETINKDEKLKKLFDLITSVKSVGKVLAVELIIYTNGFTRMLDGRKLACYTGVAPFEYSSGTSIRGGTHTSNFANGMLRHTVHMCAMNAVKYNQELKTYYQRKVSEGKKRMSALNAVRNKLLHTIVAVVKRGTPYVEKLD